ncbi:MAG: hypothetical protein ABIF40_01005 [archaeon]
MSVVKECGRRLIWFDLVDNLKNEFEEVQEYGPRYKLGRQVGSVAMFVMRSAVRFKADVILGQSAVMSWQNDDLSYIGMGACIFAMGYAADYLIGDKLYPWGRPKLENMFLDEKDRQK